jgi:hypothetical protein
MPFGVMVAQLVLVQFVRVQVLEGQPILKKVLDKEKKIDKNKS